MSAKADDGREVIRVTAGGPVQYGQAVGFGFELSDGKQERFHCRYDRYAKLMQGLRAFGQIAEKSRPG